jgi:hypothetical protein
MLTVVIANKRKSPGVACRGFTISLALRGRGGIAERDIQ